MGRIKPKNCAYPNCGKCVYADCRYDELEAKDIQEQDRFDKQFEIVEPEIEKRRERQKKYNKSKKGRERQKKYCKTKKGKENEKRKRDRKVANGKNAEYCRRYYYKKKMQSA